MLPRHPRAALKVTTSSARSRRYRILQPLVLIWRKLCLVFTATSTASGGNHYSLNLCMSRKMRGFPTGVVLHTDRGIEFAANDFQEILNRHQFKHSVNRLGHCTDNAYMESFYHSLKAELIRGTVFRCVKDLWKELGRYVNGFYNSLRLHSGLNYMSPIEYEAMTA